MELGNAFQVVLFLLPGFVLVRACLLFIPTRRDAGDAEIVVGSILATVGVWLAAFALLLALSGIVTLLGWVFRQGWGPSLWVPLQAGLSLREFHGTDLVPGIALTVAAAVTGVLVAALILEEGGRVRVFQFRRGPLFIRRLRLDLNARVWNWFLQEHPGGRVFMVTLVNGTVLLAQVTEYSTDPNDDLLDIVLRGYSVWDGSGWFAADLENQALIKRDDVVMLERLSATADEFRAGAPLPRPLPTGPSR